MKLLDWESCHSFKSKQNINCSLTFEHFKNFISKKALAFFFLSQKHPHLPCRCAILSEGLGSLFCQHWCYSTKSLWHGVLICVSVCLNQHLKYPCNTTLLAFVIFSSLAPHDWWHICMAACFKLPYCKPCIYIFKKCNRLEKIWGKDPAMFTVLIILQWG